MGQTARIAITVGLLGCAASPPRAGVPAEYFDAAVIPGVPDARFWGDEWPEWSIEFFDQISDEELREQFSAVYARPHHYLAISGGGANGAYGAGILAGWSAHGTRPQFTMVTGISTGALIAPFAFLGPEYDDFLRMFYTTTNTELIAEDRWPPSAFFSDALADTEPLRELIEKYVTAEIIDAIGAQWRKGRVLWIGTVNLDAGRSVIWDIGRIATSNYPRKAELIRDVIQASAAIPGAFPPVLIPVEANGQTFEEMHVDGGTASQVFAYPAAVDWRMVTKKLKVQGEPMVYVIRNASLVPDDDSTVELSLLPIVTRSIDTLIRSQGIGDLYQIYALCNRDGIRFNLAFIPSSFKETATEAFDPVYMTKLFEFGYKEARAGYQWHDAPPGSGSRR